MHSVAQMSDMGILHQTTAELLKIRRRIRITVVPAAEVAR
jgi:hypothetical protein